MSEKTFYWYDYETFGLSPKTNRISQFAGVRTDQNLNILSKTLLYCKPTKDCLPSPTSCLITKITPQLCEQKGLNEHAFIAKIHEEFSQHNTCIVGYNSSNFDDEFTRHTLYRNFLPPYCWHYQNNNTKWDFIDVVRMCYAFKKEDSLCWVYNDKQEPSFKLSELTNANNVTHTQAHDAMSDTLALIALAKKIKITQPKLFNYALSLSKPKLVAEKIKLFTPMVHTSSKYPAKKSCTSLCVALAYHPTHKNKVIVFNLNQNPKILLQHDIPYLKEITFTKKSELPKNTPRLQIKELAFNKSPMFCVLNNLDNSLVNQLDINIKQSTQYLEFIKKNAHKISKKIEDIYITSTPQPPHKDIDQSLYDGFLHDIDVSISNEIQNLTATQLKHYKPDFQNPKLFKLFLHFKARNYPESLSDTEAQTWFNIVQSRVQEGVDNYIRLEDYFAEIKTLYTQKPQDKKLLQKLEAFGTSFMDSINKK